MKFEIFCKLLNELEHTSKRLEKTYVLSEFLAISGDELEHVVGMLTGNVHGLAQEDKLGVSVRLVIKALAVATGYSEESIEQQWKKTGDLGLVAEILIAQKRQRALFSMELTIAKVYANIIKLPTFFGDGSVDRKVKIIAELLGSATPLEGKYIMRLVLADMRIGIAGGGLRDAIVWAYLYRDINYDKEKKNIEPTDRQAYKRALSITERAYNKINDFSKIALIARDKGIKGLKEVEISVLCPVNVMLYKKALDIDDAFSNVGIPCALEYKYDGFRLQIHRKGDVVKLFTRNMEDVTLQFPDIVKGVLNHIEGDEYIIECEAVGYDPQTKKALPFQKISQRIKRKYDIDKLVRDLPVELQVFDIMMFEGVVLLDEPFEKRRGHIENIVEQVPGLVNLSRMLITGSQEEANAFYQEALQNGFEGIMAKNLEGIYKPGARVGYGMKVKPVMEPLDLAVVAATWGEGKRSGWLTSYTLACIDADGNYVEIGKVGTGIKELDPLDENEVTFDKMTKLLKPLILSEKGREVRVKPGLILEVNYEEIQKSSAYSSGYALRFPRVVRFRHMERNKPSEVALVEEYYIAQRARNT